MLFIWKSDKNCYNEINFRKKFIQTKLLANIILHIKYCLYHLMQILPSENPKLLFAIKYLSTGLYKQMFKPVKKISAVAIDKSLLITRWQEIEQNIKNTIYTIIIISVSYVMLIIFIILLIIKLCRVLRRSNRSISTIYNQQYCERAG